MLTLHLAAACFLPPPLTLRCRRPLRLPPSPPDASKRRTRWTVLLPPGLRELRVGGIAVPRHLWDPRMRQRGVYRSVEYRIENLTLDGAPISSTRHLSRRRLPDVVATLRPQNRLLPRFERPWPVAVSLADARLLSYAADLLCCALVTLALSASFLCIGAFGPRVISIYSIPTASMYPTLRVGDALLVEKVSLRSRPPRDGEIVLFRPPLRLRRLLRPDAPDEAPRSRRLLHRNDLFVKRVVAVAGDILEVRASKVVVNGVAVDPAAPGSPIVPPRRVPDGFVFVVGDNPQHSLDSRFWGLLPVDNVVGRPVARIFPLDRLEIGV